MGNESAARPFYTVLVLAFACSILVSSSAVLLRPLQEENRLLDQKKNILRAAGLYRDDIPVETLFAAVETRVIELATGEFVAEQIIPPASYDQLKAALSAEYGRTLDRDNDPAGLRRLERYSLVYLIREKKQFTGIILPVRGKGLWSTMYGYLSLDADLSTIRGISFYEHGETPGLGGEIDNKKWQAGWQGKQVYSPDRRVGIRVVKGKAPESGSDARYQVDGLSGATMTANGVNEMMHFWLGEHGFQPFLDRIKKQGGING